MQKKLFAVLLLTCVLLTGGLNAVYGQTSTSVGVKKGDWMEYTVSGSGNLPEGHNVVWAKVEVIDVAEDGSKIWVNIVSITSNGSIFSSVRDIGFAAGDLESWIIIPANLNPGDSFYDQAANDSITIQGEETRMVAGANRVVNYGNSSEIAKVWDKATGMYVQTIDSFPDYEISANMTATNIWQPQILGLDQNLFYNVMAVLVTAVVTAVVAVVASWAFFRRRRRLQHP